MFQSRKQDYFNWKSGSILSISFMLFVLFQSRKQDYFNWKPIKILNVMGDDSCFSPASRIILIESCRWPGCKGDNCVFQSRKQDYFNWKPESQNIDNIYYEFQSRKQDYFNWKWDSIWLRKQGRGSFSPASRIILIESQHKGLKIKEGYCCFSPASRIILIESGRLTGQILEIERRFSPASRIILIERTTNKDDHIVLMWFQSRKQDYFNWKIEELRHELTSTHVSVPQAGLF